MSDKKLTKQRIFDAADHMIRTGSVRDISVTKIRQRLDGKGSSSTINDALNQWSIAIADQLDQLEAFHDMPSDTLNTILALIDQIRSQEKAQAEAQFNESTQQWQEKIDQANTRQDEAEKQYNALLRTKHDLSETITQIENEYSDLERRYQGLTVQLETAKRSESATQARLVETVEDYTGRINTLTHEKGDLTAEYKRNKQYWDKREEELNQTVDSLRSDINELCEKHKEEKIMLVAQIDDQKVQIDQLLQDKIRLEESVRLGETQVASIKEDKQQLKSEVDELHTTLGFQKHEITELNKQADAQKEKIAQLNTTVSRIKGELEQSLKMNLKYKKN